MSIESVSRPRAPAGGAPPRAITIAVLAMGGEGGGVLADWLVDLGEANGFVAQATSVPGVAQRTGATIYYVELFPEAAVRAAGREPVLALMPTPGEVDVVVASELMEAGRAIQRGLVSDDRTTLVASTHRVYSMTERTAMGDGRVDAGALLDACGTAARRFVAADFARLADEARSVIGASLFGALAGTGALPFARERFEDAVRRGGVGVQASLAAFEAGFAAARAPAASGRTGGDGPDEAGASRAASSTAGSPAHAGPLGASPQPASRDRMPGASRDAAGAGAPARRTVLGPRLHRHEARIAGSFPEAVHEVVRAGVLRTADWQDEAYAAEYLDRLAPILEVDATVAMPAGEPGHALLSETARCLALWMTYEDTVRVADLKTRRTRFERVAAEVRLADGQLLDIGEFLHPRIEEIADTLPAGIGRWLLGSPRARRAVGRFTREGRVVLTSSIRGFVLLYGVASLRRMRRASLRYGIETARIRDWLARIESIGPRDPALALEVARCQRLVKGYGDTHARGWGNFERLMQAIDRLPAGTLDAAGLRSLRDAALADEGGAALRAALERLDDRAATGTGAPPVGPAGGAGAPPAARAA
jgi:indolepyruvate ferredoxin oxidoreductase beta subunit